MTATLLEPQHDDAIEQTDRPILAPTPADDDQLQAEWTLGWLPELSRADLVCVTLAALAFLAVSFRPLGGRETWARLVAGRTLSQNTDAGAELGPAAFAQAWVDVQLWQLAGPQGLVLAHAVAAALGVAFVATVVRWSAASALRPRLQQNNNDPALPPRRSLLAIAVVLAVLVWSPATHGLLTGRAASEVDLLSAHTPYFLADEMVRRHVAGRCLAPVDWADFLVWKTTGAVEPLIDAGYYAANDERRTAYDTVFKGDDAWLDAVDAHAVRWLILDHAQHGRLYAAAVDHPRCRTRYLDQQAALIEVLPPSTDAASMALNNTAFNELNAVQRIEQPAAP